MRRSLTIVFLAVLCVLTGCSRWQERAEIVILNGAEPESLDPHIFTAQPDGRIIAALFEGLTRYDPKTGEPIPGLAERWDVSADHKTYLFYLRSNLLWSTGEPLTAEDVVYSWRRLASPLTAGGYSGALFLVKNAEAIISGQNTNVHELGVRALDSRRVEVELTAPAAFFLDICAYKPLAVVPRRVIETMGDRWLLADPLPVSGPYLLKGWRIHDRVRLRKNPLYWDAANTQNELVDILPMESPSTALNLFLSGEADIIWDKGLIPSELLDLLKQKPFCHSFDYLGTYFIRMNVTRPPFNDPRVRKALAMALDKQRIVDRVIRGGEKIGGHFTPAATRNYTPPTGLLYNPEKARALLAEAGYPQGRGFRTFSYLINTSRQHEQIAIELREMWQRELGITMEIRQTEFKVYLMEQDKLNYDLCRASWVGDYNDANTFLDLFMSHNGNNRTGWKNEEYDRLLHASNLESGIEKRAGILQAAETLLTQEAVPIIPLYFYKGFTFFDPEKIDGIYFNVIDEHPVQTIRKKRK